MNDIAKLLADNLRRLRELKGLRQVDLAEKSKLSLGTIQGYESCRRWPERPYIAALAKALEVDETILFSESAYEESSKSVKSLLEALMELQKENEQLRDFYLKVPRGWVERLLARAPKDFGAIAARAFLTGDLSELRALKLPNESTDLLMKLVKKNGLQHPL